MSADEDSKNPESEASTGQPDFQARVESRMDSIWEFVERLEETIGEHRAENDALREELQAEREARQQAESALRERVSELESRTDLRRLIDRTDGATAQQRSEALLQHLRRKAQQRQRDGREPVARLDKESAETALHHPDMDRTQVYKDMERVSRWFADDVCRYDDGELWLDLTSTNGQLSHHVEGVKASPQSEGPSGGQTARSDGGDTKLG